jgi:protein-tyrosine phosphatase
MDRPVSVLFVCLGNICRSPVAEGVFIHLAQERGVLDRFRVDSAGTGHWHVGRPADPRSLAVAERHCVFLPSRARQVDPASDFPATTSPETTGFDLLIGMDRDNCAALRALGAPAERVGLLRGFDPALAGEPLHRLDVPDPYYGGPEGFEHMYEMIHAACAGLLSALLNGRGSLSLRS